MNLASVLTGSASRHADRPAIRLDGLDLTYAELDELSARAATLLRVAGIRAGDRVALMLPNVPHFALAYFAVLRLGAIVVPLNPLLKRREVATALANSGSALLIVWDGAESEARAGATTSGCRSLVVTPRGFFDELAQHPATTVVTQRDAEHTAVVLYTSGTTGRPKGAELTHANLLTNADAVASTFAYLPNDVVLGSLPLFHAFGQTCGLNAAMLSGSLLTLLPRFDPSRALRIIERDAVTIFQGVPTMFAALLHHRDPATNDTTTLRLCASGGDSLPVQLLGAFQHAFDVTIHEGYGLSETSPVATFNRPGHVTAGSVGTPITGVMLRVVNPSGREVAVGEVGELLIRGPNVLKGYWNDPDATAEAITDDGWFRTGDLGRIDDGGCCWIVDRKKDVIVRGGYNVYPREVEEVLAEHPAVREAAVVGVPDAVLGQEVGAAIALHPGANASVTELKQHVSETLGAYKYPRHVWLVDALPKGPTGKILKRDIQVPSCHATTQSALAIPEGG